MPLKTLTATVDATTTGRVDAVVRQLSGSSHSQVRGMFDYDCVSIDGQPCTDGATPVSEGNVVSLRYNPDQRYREKKSKRWDDRTFSIVFEDEDLIVVDKAAGTLTVPTDKDETNTLLERVSIYISHGRRNREAALVHRLDRAVSGLLLFGKHEAVGNLLIEQFKERKPKRVYAAIVAGVMEADDGTFVSHLATGKNLDRYEARESKQTEKAITHFKVDKRFEDTTLIEAVLETGKRNQIRVHFAGAGHPILGDPRYETEKATHARWVRKRIALHAKTLGFVHPVSGTELTFHSPLPAAMQKFIAGGRPRRPQK
jgi:23S rRNA pseudouridine1911/1915/1917 synthase